jgi:4-amino-4-deoxy-L-arabinose transferase-like glycosyltransferase
MARDDVTAAARRSTLAAQGSAIGPLLVVTLAGFALRAWDIGSAGIGQYDEGVYAASALGMSDPEQGYTLWPGQDRFSPPVFFTLVSLAFRLLGPSDTAAIWVNVMLGSLTIPVVWWATRRWFGAAAAIAAATLVALSEFHIIMSRSALTDVAFALTLVIALVTVAAFLEHGGWWRAVVAGLATGLAWNTKYHGWFALVIGAGALAGWWLFGRAGRATAQRRVAGLALAAGVAWLAYLPWMLHISEQEGAVGGWARYFFTMLSSRWVHNFVRHASEQFYLEGPLTRVAIPAALTITLAVAGRELAGRRGVLLAGAAILLAATSGGFAAGVALTALAVPALLRQRTRPEVLVLLAWIALWIVAAPMYRPYFRLLLPLALALAIASGYAISELLTRPRESAGPRQAVAAVAVAAAVAVIALRLPDASDPWRPGTSQREASRRISAAMAPGVPVAVAGEPTVAFYLRTEGQTPLGDITGARELDTLPRPYYLVTGVYARRAEPLRRALAAQGDDLTLVARYPMSPTEIRILDDFTPAGARRYRQSPDSTFDLLLFRLGATPGSGR